MESRPKPDTGSTPSVPRTLPRKSLPADQYPTLVKLADHLMDGDMDGLFEFGLETWIAGLEHRLKKWR